jgi:hypothetical protein
MTSRQQTILGWMLMFKNHATKMLETYYHYKYEWVTTQVWVNYGACRELRFIVNPQVLDSRDGRPSIAAPVFRAQSPLGSAMEFAPVLQTNVLFPKPRSISKSSPCKHDYWLLTFRSQHVQNTTCSDHFWKLRWWNIARHCCAKRIWKWKC